MEGKEQQPKVTKQSKKDQEMEDLMMRGRRKQRDTNIVAALGLPIANTSPVHVPLDKLIPYSNIEAGHDRQPFLVRDDDEMKALVEDVKENGIFAPLIVNKKGSELMILSGHRRVYAAKIAGLTEVPCLIQEYDDIKAANVVIQSNLLNREKILPSERAAAYKLKMDVLKAQRQQNNEEGAQIEHPNKGVKSVEIVAQEEGVSRAQIQRYISLTSLIPELLAKVDTEEIPVNAGVNISSLTKTAQKRVYEVLTETRKPLTLNMSQKIKELKSPSKEEVRQIIAPQKPKKEKVVEESLQEKNKAVAEVPQIVTAPQQEARKGERIIPIPFSNLADKFPATATDDEIIKEILEALSLRWTSKI